MKESEACMKEPSTPLHEFPTECFDEFLLFDEEDWRVLEPLFCENKNAADHIAHMLFFLIDAIEGGEGERARALYTMRDGIRFCFKYTEANKAALELYYLSLGGRVRPPEDPQILFPKAIARAKEDIEESLAAERRAGKKRKHRRGK
jgi:hypothetical protein